MVPRLLRLSVAAFILFANVLLQALGTTAGSVHIFELLGRGTEWRRIACHNARINDICTDIVSIP